MDIKIQNKKIELIQWLSTLSDKGVIDEIMQLRKSEKNDWWNEISEKERLSLEKGIEDADSGKLNPHSEAKKIYEKW